MRKRVWWILSHVPGTSQHRHYEWANAWSAETNRISYEAFGICCPQIPVPLPRDPIAILIWVQSGVALVQSIAAFASGASGEDAAAIFEEWAPCL